MKILYTIAGRAGSKGIKSKNIRDFCGKPLPFYSLSAIDLYAKGHPEHDIDIAVSSDSEVLLAMFENNTIRNTHQIKRSPDLSGDIISKFFVIRDCLEKMEERLQVRYDMVVDLDITSPLRTVANIENLISTQIENDFDTVFSVTDSRRNPYFNMVKHSNDGGYDRVIDSEYSARQQAPEVFDINGSMYSYEPDFLRNKNNLFDGKCGIIKMIDTGVLDLDHENDFEFMEVVAGYLYATRPEFRSIREHICIC
jgi:CMP-N,N'-diacetyllegionaminic acid synthase